MLSMTGFANLNQHLETLKKIVDSSNIIYPQFFEGFAVDSLNSLEYRNLVDSSFYYFLNALNIPHERYILIAGFFAIISLLTWCTFRYFNESENIETLFLIGTLMCLLGELFIPIGRYPYYDIQWLLPLLIIISKADLKSLFLKKSIILLIVGLALSIGCFVWIPKFLFFSSYLISTYIILSSFSILKKEKVMNKT